MTEVLGDCSLELAGQFSSWIKEWILSLIFSQFFTMRSLFNLLGKDMFFFQNVRNTHPLHENPCYLSYHLQKTDELCVPISPSLSAFSLIVGKVWFIFHIDTTLQFNVYHPTSIFERLIKVLHVHLYYRENSERPRPSK